MIEIDQIERPKSPKRISLANHSMKIIQLAIFCLTILSGNSLKSIGAQVGLSATFYLST
jgi:hypothetical protein